MENHGGMISSGKLLIRLPELYGNSTNSHLIANVGELGDGNDKVGLRGIFCLCLEVIFNIKNLMTWGRRLYFPSEGRRGVDFYRP
jgi:hypothetical protein